MRARRRHPAVVLALLVFGVASLAAGGIVLGLSAAAPTASPRSAGTAGPGGAQAGGGAGVGVRGPGAVPAPTTGHASGSTVPTSVTTPRPATPSPPPRRLPGRTRIVIPSIGVDAAIERLGLNSDGTLQVPTDFAEAGWWSGGPFPGDRGPAVVVGHVSSVAGPAVFYRLDALVPGDLVIVVRASGSRATFRVTRLLEVAKSAFPTRLVYGPAAGRQLRLVTCGGPFDTSTGHFVDNLIVFASYAGP